MVSPSAMKFNDQRQGNQKQRGNIHPYAAYGPLANNMHVYKPILYPYRSFSQEPKWGLIFTLPLKKKKDEIISIDAE